MEQQIKINDKVRSFDVYDNRELVGKRAFYVEGVVTDFTTMEGYKRYEIMVSRTVFAGRVHEETDVVYVYPAVNGQPYFLGTTDYVELIQE